MSLAPFDKKLVLREAGGHERTVTGLFVALPDDEGETWPTRRLVTDGGLPRGVDGGGNTGRFMLGPDRAEPGGYLSVCRTPDHVVHRITSKQHYAFNLAWIRAPMPEPPASSAPGERRRP